MKILSWLFTLFWVAHHHYLTYRYSILCVVLAFLQNNTVIQKQFGSKSYFQVQWVSSQYIWNVISGSVEFYPQCVCRGRLLILRYILRAAMFTTLETLPEWNNQDLWAIGLFHLHGGSVKKRVGVFGPEEVKVVETFIRNPDQQFTVGHLVNM